MHLKKRVYETVEASGERGTLSWYVDVIIMSLILLNVLAIILESIDTLRMRYEMFFFYFEVFSVSVFTVEYLLRIWSANADPKYQKSVVGNVRFAFTPMAIIDLLAILPFFLPFFGIDLRQLRILRLLRIIRVLKLARYFTALSLMGRVLNKKKEELVITVGVTTLILVLISSLMYYIENDVQPEHFSSIPATMWWGVATLTTVGYGDVYPITVAGRILGGFFAIIGIGLFALPAGILASGFSKELSKEKTETCPNCGEEL